MAIKQKLDGLVVCFLWFVIFSTYTRDTVVVGHEAADVAECLTWAAEGECMRSVVFMHDHCKFACEDKIDWTTHQEAILKCGKGDTEYRANLRRFLRTTLDDVNPVFWFDTASILPGNPVIFFSTVFVLVITI